MTPPSPIRVPTISTGIRKSMPWAGRKQAVASASAITASTLA